VSAKSSDKKPLSLPEAAGSNPPSPDKRELDVAIVCGVSDDGQGVDVIRRRGERLEAGTVRRLEQGKPIHGEVVRLRPREQFPMICDVEVEMPAPGQSPPGQSSPGQSSSAPSSSGQPPTGAITTGRPAQVATETYRKNWDAIYGRSKKPDPLLN
jgi:hypothetical protein